MHAANTFVYWFFFVSARDLKEHGPRRRRGNQSPSGALISARFPTARNVYRDDYRFVVDGTGLEQQRRPQRNRKFHSTGGYSFIGEYGILGLVQQIRSYSAIFFHFLIFVLKVPNGATVLTCMNLYTSQTAVLVASSAHFLICGLNTSSSLSESIIA